MYVYKYGLVWSVCQKTKFTICYVVCNISNEYGHKKNSKKKTKICKRQNIKACGRGIMPYHEMYAEYYISEQTIKLENQLTHCVFNHILETVDCYESNVMATCELLNSPKLNPFGPCFVVLIVTYAIFLRWLFYAFSSRGFKTSRPTPNTQHTTHSSPNETNRFERIAIQ